MYVSCIYILVPTSIATYSTAYLNDDASLESKPSILNLIRRVDLFSRFQFPLDETIIILRSSHPHFLGHFMFLTDILVVGTLITIYQTIYGYII